MTARITDFGVGWLFEDARVTSDNSVVGTPEYMAPEYAQGEPVTPAVDVYAAGILLYELLCGITPFVGGSSITVLRRHINMAPPMPTSLHPDVRELLSQLLSKAAADRPTAALAATAMTQLAGRLMDEPPAVPLRRPAVDPSPESGPIDAPGGSSGTMRQAPTVAAVGVPAELPGDDTTVTVRRPPAAAVVGSAGGHVSNDPPATLVEVRVAAPPAPGKRSRRKPTLIAVGMAALVIVGGGVAVATLSDSDNGAVQGVPRRSSAPPSAQESVAVDAFDRADSISTLGVAETGQEWITPSGVWGISSGRAYLLSDAPGVALLPVGLTDVTVAADVVRPWINAAGVVVRADGRSNRIVANFDAASAEFRITTVADATNVTAAAVFVPPAEVPVGTSARIVLTVLGDRVAASLNGSYNLEYTLPTDVRRAINGTAVGLRQTVAGIDTTSFDNIAVTEAAADGSSSPRTGG